MSAALLESDPKTTIERFSLADQRIAQMRANYAGLAITDAQSYEAVRLAIADCRTERVGIDKYRLAKTAESREYVRQVNALAGKQIAEIEAIEVPLKEMKFAVDEAAAAKKRQREEAERLAIEAELQKKREAQEAIERVERERIAEEQAAIAAKLAEERRALDEAKRIADEANRIEQDRIKAVQAKLLQQKRQQDEAARIERERVANERAELLAKMQKLEREERARKLAEQEARDAKERTEKARREYEEREAARVKQTAEEAARRERLRPDGEKLRSFAKLILAIKVPEVRDEEAIEALDNAMRAIVRICETLESFVVDPETEDDTDDQEFGDPAGKTPYEAISCVEVA